LVAVAERVKELREKKAQKEKKLREKELKQKQRETYKWLDKWSPAVPTAGVGVDETYVNNANNINNAAAAAAAAAATGASLMQHLRRSNATAGYPSRRRQLFERSQQSGRARNSSDRLEPPSLRMRSVDQTDHRSRHYYDGIDDENTSSYDVESQRHGRRRHDDRRHHDRRRQRYRSSSSTSSSSVDRHHKRQRHSTTRNGSPRHQSRRARRRHRD